MSCRKLNKLELWLRAFGALGVIAYMVYEKVQQQLNSSILCSLVALTVRDNKYNNRLK